MRNTLQLALCCIGIGMLSVALVGLVNIFANESQRDAAEAAPGLHIVCITQSDGAIKQRSRMRETWLGQINAEFK